MLIFLYGPDSFRIHERLGSLQAAFRQKYDSSGHQIEQFTAATITPDQLRRSLLTAGLFSTRRFVVCSDIFDLPNTLVPLWLEAIANSSSDTIIIATATQLPKVKSELKIALLAAERVEEYPLLKAAQLPGWIKARFAQYHASATPAAITCLIESIGSDLWRLHNTIIQLSHYTQQITEATVQQFVPSALDDNIFHLTDAIAERNPKKALQLMQQQLASGANQFYILTMLARQLSILIQVKEPTNGHPDLHPYVIKKAQHHAQRFSLTDLIQLHHAVVELDVQLKSSTVPAALLLDRFIVQCTLQ